MAVASSRPLRRGWDQKDPVASTACRSGALMLHESNTSGIPSILCASTCRIQLGWSAIIQRRASDGFVRPGSDLDRWRLASVNREESVESGPCREFSASVDRGSVQRDGSGESDASGLG